MQYIGNFNSWIDPDIINTILTSHGERRPKTESGQYESSTYQQWKTAGFDMNKIGWHFYYNQHIFKDHIDLPLDPKGRKYKWWFSKLNPGDMFPMHIDHFATEKNVQRFWMACQDHQPGHVFLYGDRALVDYKAGDIFKFTAENIWHAAANLGFTPKISFQLMFYD
jgi:hypothetical protein